MKTNVRCVLYLLLLWDSSAFVASTWGNQSKHSDLSNTNQEPRIFCPAIEQDERRRTNNPDEPSRPINLVVLGTSKLIEEHTVHGKRYEVQVEKVLYGSLKEKTVRFTHLWNAAQENPSIFALVPAIYDDSYELKYMLEGDEVDSQLILSAARLDYHVLSSRCIFIGKEIQAGGNYLHTIEVMKHLHGPELAPGQKITAEMNNYFRRSDILPNVAKEEMIFFVNSIVTGEDIYEMPASRSKENVYRLTTSLREDQEQAVLDALGRRDKYPITEVEEDGERFQFREIQFQGTISQAIHMMGSASDASVTLAARKIIANKSNAIKDVVEAIEHDLFKQKPDDSWTFPRLRNLILLLETMEENGSKGEAVKLLEKMVNHIAKNPDKLPVPERRTTYFQNEKSRTDVNHALVWLLMIIKPEDLGKDMTGRLLKLRDTSNGEWKLEVQLALEAAKLEDTLDLKEAMDRTRQTKPLFIRSAFPMTGEEVVFSHDGKFLVAGTTIWNVDNWSVAGSFENEGTLAAMFFSPDDQFLYVLGGAGKPIHYRLNWRKGEREDIFKEHTGGITSASMSIDGKRLMTISSYDHTVRVWELPGCTLLQTYDLPRECYHGTISPNGLFIIHQTNKEEITVKSLNDDKPQKITLDNRCELNKLILTPDGKLLIVSTYDFSEVKLMLYNVDEDFRHVGSTMFQMDRCTGLLASPDSSHLIVADQEGQAKVLSLPELKLIKSLPKLKMGFGTELMAFSPDGKRLVIGSSHDTVMLFDTKTYDRILPSAGHGSKVTSIYFSSDGKSILSTGSDNTVCRWNAESGGMEFRFSLPSGFKIISVREDGRYLACLESEVLENMYRYSKDQSRMKIVDSDSGKVISELTVPVGSISTRIHWAEDHKAVLATWKNICILDYLQGKIIKDTKVDRSDLGNGMGELTEDGKYIYIIEGGGKRSWLNVRLIDIQSGKVTEAGTYDLTSFSGNKNGLVPGGKYFFIGDPGIYIFERSKPKLVLQKEFQNSDVLRIAFLYDGSRFAIVTGARIFIDENLRQYDSETQSIIRIQETLTGKTSWASLSPTRWIKDLVFSRDGRRLAAVTDVGDIAIWKLAD